MDTPQETDPQNKNHAAYFVPGLHRGLVALEVVAAAQEPLSISEIAVELGLTRSSTFRLVYTLVQMGFLAESGKSKHYELGPRVLNIGFAYLASQSIIEMAKPELERLRDLTSVTSHLAIRDERDVLYLGCVQTRSGFLSNMNVGSRVPAFASPMGWYLLSQLSDQELGRLMGKGPFQPLTDQTPTTLQELAETIRRVSGQPCFVSHGVLEAGGASVSAPVFDHEGRVVAAIDISGPNSAFEMDQIEIRYAEAVVDSAQRISARLGYVRKD